LGKDVVFRADAAFAKPEINEALERCGEKHSIRPGRGQPGSLAVLQQARKRRAVDQGRQVGREDDALELPSFPVQRDAVVVERDRPQPWGLWWRLVSPDRTGKWSLTSLHQRLVKTGGWLVTHTRRYWLLLVEEPSDQT